MKRNVMFALTFCGVAVMLVTSAVLTHNLFATSLPADDTPVALTTAPQVIGESVIELAQAGPADEEVPIAATKQEFVGTIAEIRGTVMATWNDGSPRTLGLNSKISMGDKIEASAFSSAKIRFQDETVLSIGENSSVVIDQYVYSPSKPDESGFATRIVRGACRVITGAITDLSPRNFKVRTRMATIGIRGCELGFRCVDGKEDIYIIEIGKLKSVSVETTTDGSPMLDVNKNQELPVDESVKKTIGITSSGHRISVTQGKGVEEAELTPDDVTSIVGATSAYAPATYELDQTGDGAVIKLQPKPRSDGGQN